MLGINAPKVLVKGEYAKAVRKAALASVGAKKQKKMPQKFHLIHINLNGYYDWF